MEIGGYRELDLRTGNELYSGNNVVRLNSGRYGIYHAIRCLGCKKVLLPYYQCSTVGECLIKYGIEVECFHIGEDMLPKVTNQDANTAYVVVNYFGLLDRKKIEKIVKTNKNVILDNTQALFEKNITGAISVYSPRKFVGVSDGAYVVGENVCVDNISYRKSVSASTSDFLLARIETGGNSNYQRYLENEERITNEGIRSMSDLTAALLDNVDYNYVRLKRIENYKIAESMFRDINQLKLNFYNDVEVSVPMVYPLLIENDNIRKRLKDNSIFVGQWWRYLLDNTEINDFERSLSRYLIPIQIDQRYGFKEIQYVSDLIHKWVRE